MKTKINRTRRVYAVLAALAALLTALALFSCAKNDGAETESSSAETESGKLPAVFCGGRLYISDGHGSYGGMDMLPEGFAKYGKIASERADSALPGTELESRGVAVGDVVYASADNAYAVYVVTDGGLYRYLTASVNGG